MTSLELKNITKRFGKEVVLDGLSLKVESGETLVLFGPSGAGKTVLLRLVAGVIEADDGEVLIGGEDVAEIEPEDRGIGMAFQNFALFPHMTAFDNIASPLTATRTPKDKLKEGVASIARLLKIEHVLSHAPRALSNGQKQRTALARALIGNPGLLLLDDPLRNVDAKLRFEMRLELPQLLSDRGTTVVYVTQDYKEAMAFGDRIAVMAGGTIQQFGSPEDVYLKPANIEIARLFGDPVINLLKVTPGKDETGIFTTISNQRVALDDGYKLAVDRPCLLGIRPEAIAFVEEGTLGAIPVEVEAETPLNEKTVTLVLTAGGREILVSRPASMPGPASGKAFIHVEGKSAHLFDARSGDRIEAQSTLQGAAA